MEETQKAGKKCTENHWKDVDHLMTRNILFMMIYTVGSRPGDLSISAHPTIGW